MDVMDGTSKIRTTLAPKIETKHPGNRKTHEQQNTIHQNQ